MTLEQHEIWSTITHWVGAVTFLFYGSYLIRNANPEIKPSVSIFVFCSVFLLFASGLYHIMPQDSYYKKPFLILDHSAIYLLMGGTYHVCYDLIFSDHNFRKIKRTLFTAFWTIIGILIGVKAYFFFNISATQSLGMFLVAGWLGIFGVYFMIKNSTFYALRNVFLGGIIYTIGAIIDYYNLKFPIADSHVIFHIFVLMALLAHYNFVAYFVKKMAHKTIHNAQNMMEEAITHITTPVEQKKEKISVEGQNKKE